MCLAYRKEDRLDVLLLAKSEYLQPPMPRNARQQAAAAAAAASSSTTSSTSNAQSQPTTPTGKSILTTEICVVYLTLPGLDEIQN